MRWTSVEFIKYDALYMWQYWLATLSLFCHTGPILRIFVPLPRVSAICVTLLVETFLYFLQHQMVVFELSPEDVLTFDVEDISDTMQSSIALSCSNTTDNSLVLFAVSSNPPLRYSITPDTGFLLTSEPCVMSVTLSNSELGLVRFLSTVPGDYFLSDHIAIVADIHKTFHCYNYHSSIICQP